MTAESPVQKKTFDITESCETERGPNIRSWLAYLSCESLY